MPSKREGQVGSLRRPRFDPPEDPERGPDTDRAGRTRPPPPPAEYGWRGCGRGRPGLRRRAWPRPSDAARPRQKAAPCTGFRRRVRLSPSGGTSHRQTGGRRFQPERLARCSRPPRRCPKSSTAVRCGRKRGRGCGAPPAGGRGVRRAAPRPAQRPRRWTPLPAESRDGRGQPHRNSRHRGAAARMPPAQTRRRELAGPGPSGEHDPHPSRPAAASGSSGTAHPRRPGCRGACCADRAVVANRRSHPASAQRSAGRTPAVAGAFLRLPARPSQVSRQAGAA